MSTNKYVMPTRHKTLRDFDRERSSLAFKYRFIYIGMLFVRKISARAVINPCDLCEGQEKAMTFKAMYIADPLKENFTNNLN